MLVTCFGLDEDEGDLVLERQELLARRPCVVSLKPLHVDRSHCRAFDAARHLVGQRRPQGRRVGVVF